MLIYFNFLQLKELKFYIIMTEDNVCLICLDELLDTNCVLECCMKKVHSSCIKQWWDIKNMSLDDAYCPHCQQKAKLKKINNDTKINKIHPTNLPNARYEYINPTFGIENIEIAPNNSLNIRPNVSFDLTDNEIVSINCNSNNVIPINNFNIDDDSDNDSTNSNDDGYLYFFIRFIPFIMLILLIAFILYTWMFN